MLDCPYIAGIDWKSLSPDEREVMWVGWPNYASLTVIEAQFDVLYVGKKHMNKDIVPTIPMPWFWCWWLDESPLFICACMISKQE